jgi:hypothetical protein
MVKGPGQPPGHGRGRAAIKNPRVGEEPGLLSSARWRDRQSGIPDLGDDFHEIPVGIAQQGIPIVSLNESGEAALVTAGVGACF